MLHPSRTHPSEERRDLRFLRRLFNPHGTLSLSPPEFFRRLKPGPSFALCLGGLANYPEKTPPQGKDAWHRYRNSDVKSVES